MRSLPLSLAACVAFACSAGDEGDGTVPPSADASPDIEVTTLVRVDPSGTWSVTFADPAWTFAGDVGGPVAELSDETGVDALGRYREVAFAHGDPGARRGAIRAYADRPVVLFTDAFTAAASAPIPFPSITSYPDLPYHLSYGDSEFAPHSFETLTADSPWLFFDDQANAFLLSAADHFPSAATRRLADRTIASGIDPSITEIPAGFSHAVILTATRGVNRAYQVWGDALLALGGKTRPTNDAGVELERLGYWTDNGATYYYDYEQARGYPGTLLAMRDQFRSLGIELGYLQLDSWWYPKGDPGRWDDRTRGLRVLDADPTLFPDGLAAFREALGLPLVVHARWIDDASPYRGEYRMSADTIVDPAYWQSIASRLKSSGVVVYEQDWLNARALPRTDNLGDQEAFLDHMAAAMESSGLSIQYCMPLARHYLQSTRYPSVTTMRVSGDDFTPSKWVTFLYGARLAGALGVWPWADVFMSSEEGNLTLATLSGGMVGVGDPLGAIDRTHLLRSVRPDGIIVKPDEVIAPLDRSFIDGAAGRDEPIVAATRTRHGALVASYVFAFAAGAARTARFSPAELGYSGDVYVWDAYRGGGRVLAADETLSEQVSNGRAYYVVAPVGRSGIAFLGDRDKYVSLGRQRIAELSDDGRLVTTIAAAPGESSITLHGWSPSSPSARASAGAAGAVSWDGATGHFELPVTPSTGSAVIEMWR